MLDNALQKIGLSEKEAKVYLASLELGQSPVQKIAAKAKVNRATTYVILEGLMKKGIITTFEQGKKRYFVAESPDALHNIIDQQQEEIRKKEELLASLMPELSSVHNTLPNKPVVRFYEGKEGLKTLLEERLQEAPKEVLHFYPLEDVQEIFSPEESENYRKQRIARNTFNKSVASVNDLDKPVSFQLADVRKVSHQQTPFHADVAVYNDKVSISTMKGQICGVVIQSKAVADTFRSIFKLAFDSAKQTPISQQTRHSQQDLEPAV